MGRVEFAGFYEMKRIQNKVVYTAVFGNYDTVSPVNPSWDCDFICFTDNPNFVSEGWQIVNVQLNNESPSQANRRYKMLPHEYLPNYERSLYIDGNIKLVIDPSPLFEKYLNKCLIAIPKHQDRNCVYKEAQLCIKEGRVDKEITEKQMASYKSEGFPEKFGMTENGILFRKHRDNDAIKLMNAWWEEYCNGGRRDQLSLPYLIWKHDINVVTVTEGPRININYFKIDLHLIDKSKPFFHRLVRQLTSRKHLNKNYLLLSRAINLLIVIRDNLPYKK